MNSYPNAPTSRSVDSLQMLVQAALPLLCFLDLVKDWAAKTFNRVAIVAILEHKLYFSLLIKSTSA